MNVIVMMPKGFFQQGVTQMQTTFTAWQQSVD